MQSRLTVLGLIVAPLLVACDSDPVANEPAGWLSAAIQGSVSEAYEGTGEFTTAADWPSEAAFDFRLLSHGTGASAGEGFDIFGLDGGRPEVGRYVFGGPGEAGVDPGGLGVTYTRQTDAGSKGFSAREGELVITVSTPERIEGHFAFAGVLTSVCETVEGTDGSRRFRCLMYPAPPPDAERIEVSGTFSAVHGRGCVPIPEEMVHGTVHSGIPCRV